MGEGTLRIDQTISLNEIYVAGTDRDPESATLTLDIEVLGSAARYPIDCLFVIDVSATSDVLRAKEFAFDLIDQLGVDDRAGLVSYGTTAELSMPLTHNLGAVKLALADLTARGKSAMGLAMQMARREFDQAGREDAVLVEILISDGQSSVGIEPDMEGEAAAQIGVKIMSIGLGTLINRNMLEAFAEQTGGQFFQSPTDRAQTDIFMDLDVLVAAGDVRIEKRLPPELRFVEATPAASQVELHPDGTTVAVWRLADLELGERTAIDVELEVLELGDWKTDVDSTIRFVNFRGVQQVLQIPSLTVSGILPYTVPAAKITATRTIDTCLPGDQTVPEATVNVVLVIDLQGTLNGMAVVESFPAGWTFIEGDNDAATVRSSGSSAEWLFVEKLVGDAADAQREIRYSLQAPVSVSTGGSGVAQASIQGSMGSSSPRFTQPILGEDKLTVIESLPIPIVISRWDTDADELKLCEAEPEIIDFAEIQFAVSLWLSGETVPQTSNQTIDIMTMQDLIAYWLTGRSVHDSLP